MADPNWKTIADAIATKLGTITGTDGKVILRSATADIADALPPLPAAIVFPPSFNLDEDVSSDAYTAEFEFVVPFEVTAGIERTMVQIYALVNAIVPAWHSGRLLGLATIVQNSHVLSVAADEITEYDPPLPGVRGRIAATVRVPVAPRSA